MSDELEAALRRALASEADRVEPAGDGLSRIRARTARRRSWRVPALALAGTAAVLAAVAVVPRVLPQRDQVLSPAARATSASVTSRVTGPLAATSVPPVPPVVTPPVLTPSVAPPSTRSTTSTPVTRSAPPAVADLATVWPYGTRGEGGRRADADVASGRYPGLRDPAATAVGFVESFVGPAGLTAERLDAYEQGLRMLVSRDGRPVSAVFLVRARTGDDSPYLVVSASPGTGALTLRPPPARTAGAVRVGGTVRPGDAQVPAVVVELREPGADQPLARTTVPPVSGAGPVAWSGILTPSRVPSPHGVVAAWTTDPGGGVLAFTATATG